MGAKKRKSKASRGQAQRPRFQPLCTKDEVFTRAAELHALTSPCAVAERVMLCTLSSSPGKLIKFWQSEDISPFTEMTNMLAEGESALAFRLSLMKEARRRLLACAAYAAEQMGASARATKEGGAQ